MKQPQAEKKHEKMIIIIIKKNKKETTINTSYKVSESPSGSKEKQNSGASSLPRWCAP